MNIADPRLTVLDCPAQEAPAALAALGVGPADAALSSLGLSLFPDSLCESILGGVRQVLRPGATLTQFQYVSRVRVLERRAEYFDASRLIVRHFPTVERRLILRNIPPAFVYACR
jgi:phospholipid N-methyltransferase